MQVIHLFMMIDCLDFSMCKMGRDRKCWRSYFSSGHMSRLFCCKMLISYTALKGQTGRSDLHSKLEREGVVHYCSSGSRLLEVLRLSEFSDTKFLFFKMKLTWPQRHHPERSERDYNTTNVSMSTNQHFVPSSYLGENESSEMRKKLPLRNHLF